MKPPKHIKDADVKKLWVSTWDKLSKAEMVDDLSVDAFEMLCSAVVMWRRANVARLNLGADLTYIIPNGAICMHPEVKMCENLEKNMVALLKEFGLTPKSAKDMGINVDPDADDEEAEFDRL